MPVQLPLPERSSLINIPGLALATASAGIRKAGRRDLLVMALSPGSQVAGVFTQSVFAAAPVQVCRLHLALPAPEVRAILVNTGNANAGTGEQGLHNAQASCAALAQAMGLSAEQVLPFSTGVILEQLPMDKLLAGLAQGVQQLGTADWLDAAEAIMTTDTQPKAASRQLVIQGQTISLTGISKGAGMIRPNMATMLGFVATDLGIARHDLQTLVREATDQSFNAITIDGDTSTNDSFLGIATGASGLTLTPKDPDWPAVRQAFFDLSRELAQAIVRDGEGATKFITIAVEGAASAADARLVAYAIGHSPLVKTAFFASDPNLGRILAAIGYAGVSRLQAETISVHLGDVLVAERGGRAASYTEEQGQRVMAESEILVQVNLGMGQSRAEVYTCDFSYDYVKINADYRS